MTTNANVTSSAAKAQSDAVSFSFEIFRIIAPAPTNATPKLSMELALVPNSVFSDSWLRYRPRSTSQ